MEEDKEFIKLPVEDRCVHKLWKARVHGYEEAAKIFRQSSDEKSPEFNKFLGLIKKFVIDSNVAAQEKGLEATLAYVENAAVAGRTVGEVVSGIVNKCIAAPKTKIKELSLQIILMYIEIEKQDIVLEELMKGLDHKTPKNVAACINAITVALREFGEKVVGLKPILKKCPSILEHRDKLVRDEGKSLMIEMFRWIGPALKPQLSALKPVQVSELEAEFEKVKGERAMPTRFLRSQQAKQAEVAAQQEDNVDGDSGGGSDEEDRPDVDPYDLLSPVDILSKLPKDFYEKIEAKKWQERKEVLDLLEKILTDAPKLENGDYADLVKVLKKVMTKDSNVVLVGVACKCLALLVTALKKRFHPYAGAMLPACLEKFKEKKQNVVLPLRDAVDAIYVSTTLEAVQEDVLAALENKNPQVKAESVSFLGRCFTKCTPVILNKKLLKIYVTALLKTINESDQIVRENSMLAIGTAMKVVGEKAIAPFLADGVDANKMAKIKENCDKVVLCVKQPKPQKDRPTTAPPPKSVPSKSAPKPAAAVHKPSGAKVVKPSINSTTMTRKPAASSAGSSSIKSGGSKPSYKVATEKDLSEEEVDEKAENMLSPNLCNDLCDANWKTRLAAMEQLLQMIPNLDDESGTAQVLIRVLNKKPGFKDNNFQVLNLRLKSVKLICEKFKVTSTAMSYCLTDIAAFLGDAKNGSLAGEVLTSLAEATRLDHVSSEVLNYAFSVQKSPKVQQESLIWLSKAILDFGFVVEPKQLMENVKKAVAASNPAVRTACISLLGTLYLYMGTQLSFFFENEKPALVQQINAEFVKHEGESPPNPTRGGSAKLCKGSAAIEDEETAEDDTEEKSTPMTTDFNIQDIVPRVDISPQITEELLSELGDKNWKVKAEALTKIQRMITSAQFITPNLGEAAPLIGARLTDSNSKIAASAVTLVEIIAPAMGSPCKKYVRAFLPGLIQGMGDSKTWIRSSAVSCINKWGETCGFKEFFDGEIIADALKSGSPILRAELWSWLASTLTDLKSAPKEELHACLMLLYNNLEDRNAEVRKNAADAVPSFMIHLGYGPMSAACEKLKPSSVQNVKTVLDKTRGTVPDRSGTAEKVVKPKQAVALKQMSGGSKIGRGAPKGSAINSATISRTKSKTNLAPAKVVGKSKKDEDIDLSPLLQVNSYKHQRVIDESKLKILKWNFTSPREEFVELLKDQMTSSNVNKTLITNMFHADFKYHLKAIENLNEDLNQNIEALRCNLDLILKWLTLRFFDTNPSVLLKGLEYLNNVFDVLTEQNYRLSDNEASSFIPYLLLKIGDPKDTVRYSVRSIFKQLASIYPLTKLFNYVMEGLKSKNARQRTECLDQLAWFIENFGMTVCQPSALKEIAKQISDRDNAVRSSALNCIVAAYFLDGPKVYKQIGQISEKDMSLLEERIKRASKNRSNVPVATVKPTQVQQMHAPAASQVGGRSSHNHHSEEEPDVDEYEEEQPPQRVVQNSRGLPVAPSPLRHPLGRLTDPQNRPFSGPYGLDMALLESIESEGASGSSGASTTKPLEYDLAFLSEPIPGVFSQKSAASSLGDFSRSSEHSSSNNISSTIQQMASNDMETALRAIQTTENLIVTERWSQLVPHVDWLVMNMVVQLEKLRHIEHLDLVNSYRAVFSLCMKLYNVPPLCEKVTEGALEKILGELLMLLSEKSGSRFDKYIMFLKVMNSLALRILERSDHTVAVCATVKVLHEMIRKSQENSIEPAQATHYIELSMKCIWKILKFFPEWDSKLDYVKILAVVHSFFKAFPSTWWRNQSNNTPLRTIKTLIHSMARCRNSELCSYLSQVPDVTEDSELYYYVHKLLQHVGPITESKPPPQKHQNGGDHDVENIENGNAHANIRVTKANADILTEIFRKIGNKEETTEGLRLLYKFKQEHPEQPLELTQYSQIFQDYIERGLKDIELELRCESSNKSNEKDTVNNNSNCSSVPTEDKLAAYYKKKLRELQIKAGLVPTGSNSPKQKMENELSDLEQLQNISPQRHVSRVEITSPENVSKVEMLRMRLERMKQANS